MIRVLMLGMFLLSSLIYAEGKKVNLITNPNFTKKDSNGKVLDWTLKQGAIPAEEDGQNCIYLPNCDGGSEATTFVKIDPKWLDTKKTIVKLQVSTKIKTKDVKIGDASWKDTRLAMMFADEKGKMVGQWPNVICISGTTPWTAYKRDFNIPPGAAQLKVFAVNYGKTGVAYFTDIKVEPIIMNLPTNDVELPKEVKDVWSLKDAWKETNANREKICLNGLWKFRPIMKGEKADDVNSLKAWGWSKVPNIWYKDRAWNIGPVGMQPLVPEYIQVKTDWTNLEQAWYKRELEIPKNWEGRKIVIQFSMIQTQAVVYVDDKKAGEVWFPGGDVDITKSVQPGKKQTISLLVTAKPMAKEKKIFMDADRVFSEKISLKIKGIPGDVYIASQPAEEYIEDIQTRPSVSNKQIALNVKVNIKPEQTYSFSASFLDPTGKVEKSFDSKSFTSKDLKNGYILIKDSWENPNLWDIDTPQNMYSVILTLKNNDGKVIDTFLPVKFGFREFTIAGKDILLNGKIIHLRFLKVDNPVQRADKSCYQTCLKTCKRLKENNFNAFIWGNYEFTQGEVGYMEGILKAADEVGVLQAFTMPHAKDYEWKLTDEKQYKRYKDLSSWMVKKVQNHPSVMFYAMNHNSVGYNGDENPLKMDGYYKPKPTDTRKQCAIAEKVAEELDPTRLIYHHHSGKMGKIFTLNSYLNWAPIQEKNDWIQHWSESNSIPLFFVEWGLPHIASWSSYRGPEFIWMCNAYQSIWDSEFAAPFLNQNAYIMTETKQQGIKREESEWAKGTPFNFGALMGVLVNGVQDCLGIQAEYISKNWPILRAWGLTGMLPWDQEQLYKSTVGEFKEDNPDKFTNLKQPGIVPDVYNCGGQYIYSYNGDNFKPTVMGAAMRKWNRPVIGYIVDSPKHFTAANTNYFVGETVEKQFILINDARNTTKAKVSWTISKNGEKVSESPKDIEIEAKVGTTVFAAFKHEFKEAGTYKLTGKFSFPDASIQEVSINFNILPSLIKPELKSNIALFDPIGKTTKALKEIGITFDTIQADSKTDAYNVIIIGSDAITLNSKLPEVLKNPKGKSILIMEQQAMVLQTRIGFRVQEYGLRNVFVRASNHPILNGITNDILHDWRGSSTLVPDYMKDLPYYETGFPTFNWCGFKNKRVWRCGNIGNVASVLIEKPVIGNWQPLLDGAFDLQYTPLLEYTGNDYRMIFSQLDLSGRTEKSPAAELLLSNIIKYLDTPLQHKFKNIMVLGKEAETLLNKLGIKHTEFDETADKNTNILFISSNASEALKWQNKGGVLISAGLDKANSTILNPGKVKDQQGWSRLIKDFSSPFLQGISNAEFHWRTNLNFAALENSDLGENEVFQIMNNGKTIMCQIAPWMFDTKAKPYLRTTERRVYFLMSQLLFNAGANSDSVLLNKLCNPARITKLELSGNQWKGKVDKNDVGRKEKWFDPSYDDSNWEQQIVPGYFEDASKEVDADYQGYYWYRLRVNIPETLNNGKITINFGPVDDESWIWLNNTFLGEISGATGPKEFWAELRKYDLDPKWIDWDKENVITVLCKDNYMKGGIMGNVNIKSGKGAWLSSYYIQVPQKDDDPYRYYRW